MQQVKTITYKLHYFIELSGENASDTDKTMMILNFTMLCNTWEKHNHICSTTSHGRKQCEVFLMF